MVLESVEMKQNPKHDRVVQTKVHGDAWAVSLVVVALVLCSALLASPVSDNAGHWAERLEASHGSDGEAMWGLYRQGLAAAPDLLRLLANPDSQLRVSVLQLLSAMPAEIAPQVIDAIDAGDVAVGEGACQVINYLVTRDGAEHYRVAIPTLLRSLNGGELRSCALRALEALLVPGDDVALSVLLNVLDKCEDAECPLVERCLATVAQGKPVAILRDYSRKSTIGQKRLLATLSLMPRLGPEVLPVLLDAAASPELWYDSGKALGLPGLPSEVVVPYLHAWLRDPARPGRWLAADSLGAVGPDAIEATAELVRAMRSDDVALRTSAVRALARIGEVALPPLMGEVRNGDVDAIQVIGLMRPQVPAVRQVLEGILNDSSLAKRVAAAGALWRMGLASDKAFEVLISSESGQEALEDPGPGCIVVVSRLGAKLGSDTLGHSASKALARLGAPAVPTLSAALESSDEKAKQRALQALMSMDQIDGAQDALVGLLEDKSKSVRSGAVALLARVGAVPSSARPTIVRAFHSEQEEQQRFQLLNVLANTAGGAADLATIAATEECVFLRIVADRLFRMGPPTIGQSLQWSRDPGAED